MARHRLDAPAPGLPEVDVDLPVPRSRRPHRYLDPDRAAHSGELPVAPLRSRRRDEVPPPSTGPTPGPLPAPRSGHVPAPWPEAFRSAPVSVPDADVAPPPRTGAHDHGDHSDRDPHRDVRAARHDPETTPLDLAAIALAAARASTGSHRLPPLDGSSSTGGHRLPTTGGIAGPGTGRLLNPTRTVGALAVLGAVVGAGVAAAGGGAMLTADPATAAVETSLETTAAEGTTGG